MNILEGTLREFASKGYEFHQSFSDQQIATRWAKDFETDNPTRNVAVVHTKHNMYAVVSRPRLKIWRNLLKGI